MKTEPFKHAYFEDGFIDIEQAKVSIMTHSLQYGTAVFGGLRLYYNPKDDTGYIFRIRDHYRRLLGSVRLLGCPLNYDLEQLVDTTIELARRNQPRTDAYIRPFVYVADTGIGPSLAGKTLSLSIHMIPLGDYLPVDAGLHVMVSSWRRVPDSAIPSLAKASGGYINASLARKEATDNGYDEAIMLRDNGLVSEGSAENIFLVRDGRLITPALSEGILEGITRRTIIKLAEDMGLAWEARAVQRSELYIADEVFLCGTGCQVAWVKTIDKRTIGDGVIGPVSKKLQARFFAVVRGDDKDYAEWRTAIRMNDAHAA